jgi:DNA-binding MarR family transcriptional regulator
MEMNVASASAKDLRLDRQLCFAVYSAAHAFNRFYKPLLSQLGLTYPQYLVLLVLWEDDGLTVSAIGERLLLDSGTLTPLLKRLEAMGLVSRRRDERDERQVMIRLTEKGSGLRSVAESFPAKIHDASDSPGEEVDGLRRRLVDLREKLDRSVA